MRNRWSITKKLFIITTVVFAIFIVVTLLIQSLFFERLYISKKEGDLISSIEGFTSEYRKAESWEEVTELMQDYEETYNIRLVIVDEFNRFKVLQGTSASANRVDIFRSKEIGDFIRLWVQIRNNRVAIFQVNKTLIQRVETSDSGARSIIAITPVQEKNEIIFGISSLQPVNEAVDVIEGLYLYFFIGAVMLTILLAFIYSNMIAKPLVKINKAATKMAQLDFSEKCDIDTGDEIGNVAASLNFLSENLDNALNSLKEANVKLEKDIERERNLERMRREFVAAVSHELRTPITLIGGYAGALKDNVFEGEDKDYYIDVIMDEAEKMGSLVSDMLDLSSLESGNFRLSLDEFNLSELAGFTIKKYRTLIEEKRVRLITELPEELKIMADWSRLEQVITNFITNAIRHVNEGGSIWVRILQEDELTVFEVENTGSHIPEEEISKIWDKFYKIDKARSRQLGGTGIGLSIVKNILTLHGYEYGAVNTEEGVKFYFRIPRGELQVTRDK